MPLKKICGEGVAILGFGRSGHAVADFLLPRGICPTVYVPSVPDDVAEYVARGLKFCVGEFPSHFRQRLLVRSPGIRPDLPSLLHSLAAGAQLTSEAELFLSLTKATVIGVTGSDGKTTTAALTAALLRGARKCVFLGGNNGVPLLPRVDEMTGADVAVLELSSFQLMTVAAPPPFAVITNVTPNHLNWHLDMEEYFAAKCRIFDERSAFLMTNADQERTSELAQRCSCPVGLFSSRGELPPAETALTADEKGIILCRNGVKTRHVLGDFHLPGRHNLENLMAALGVATAVLGAPPSLHSLADFYGVPHRLQLVRSVHGVDYINSSIDTSPSRTVAALATMQRPTHVILGGRGKGVSFEILKKALQRYAKTAFLYGEAAPELADAIGDAIPVYRFEGFYDAARAAIRNARAGETVLLSPACTAFDQFRDFEARGEAFARLVREI